MIARILARAEVPALVAVPLVLIACAFLSFDQTALLTLVVALGAIAVFFARFETSGPALRQIMPTAVLGALGAAGRILFAPFPDVKPVSAICIVAGVVFGRQSGFLVGAIAALVSNFFFGQGAWTPWQMYAWGLVGYLAGVLGDRGAFRRRGAVLVYGFFSALLYGLLLNGWYVVGFVHPITWPSVVAAYASGAPFDLVHGASTVGFLAIIYEPWRRILARVKRKYGLAGGRATMAAPAQAGACGNDVSGGEAVTMRSMTMAETAAVLRHGHAAIFPTETVYGLGVAVNAAAGPDVLYRLKERDRAKPVAWLVADVADLTRYGRAVPDFAQVLARTFWPGPLTLIVKASDEVPEAFRSAEGTIGLRMPNNPCALALIRDVGCPLATTSANRSGRKPPRSFDVIDPVLAERVDALLADESDAEKSGVASTILDCTEDHPVMTREGAITIADIQALA